MNQRQRKKMLTKQYGTFVCHHVSEPFTFNWESKPTHEPFVIDMAKSDPAIGMFYLVKLSKRERRRHVKRIILIQNPSETPPIGITLLP